MKMRQIGREGPFVSMMGLGCMGMSDLYGPADEAQSISTIHAAMEAGITLLDTGDFYGMGHNEMLLRKAIQGKRERVFIQVKFGALRGPDGSWLGLDVRPQAVKDFLAYSLKRLGTDYMDLYQPSRVDPAVPIEETVGAVADLVKAGYVRHIGLSEAGAKTLEKAHAVYPIAALQIEYSLISRGIEKEILPAARKLGIGVTAYGVLSRGLLSGRWTKDRASNPRDFRSHLPRMSGANLEKNLKLVETLKSLARDKNGTSSQISIAWVLSRGEDIVPLVGARSPERLAEALGALEIKLSSAELTAIEKAVSENSVAGMRYDERQMAWLDSEKKSGL